MLQDFLNVIGVILVLICGRTLVFVIKKAIKPKDRTERFKADCEKLSNKIASYPLSIIAKDRLTIIKWIQWLRDDYTGSVKDEGVLKTGITKLYDQLNNHIIKIKQHELKAV